MDLIVATSSDMSYVRRSCKDQRKALADNLSAFCLAGYLVFNIYILYILKTLTSNLITIVALSWLQFLNLATFQLFVAQTHPVIFHC